ncbi:hypothetical protein ACHAXT_012804, partial [Thalassiosira profunda]
MRSDRPNPLRIFQRPARGVPPPLAPRRGDALPGIPWSRSGALFLFAVVVLHLASGNGPAGVAGEGFERNEINVGSCEEANDGAGGGYWDSMARCGTCTDNPHCRFCLTTLRCEDDSEGGSDDQDGLLAAGGNASACHAWALDALECPALPDCNYTSCATCARAEGCVWCAALDRCLAESESEFEDCEGHVSMGGECPSPFGETTTVDGALVVRGDDQLGGGALRVSGPCRDSGCRDGGEYSLVLDGGKFDVRSGGRVALAAADTSSPNVPASDVVVQAGAGRSPVGGGGGDIFAFAGDSAAELAAGGNAGKGGSVHLAGGQASGVGSVGGAISMEGGGSASVGGDISILSGSGEVTSGKVVLASNEGRNGAASGDVFVGSGATGGANAPSGAVRMATGATAEAAAGTLQLAGGDSELGQGGDVEILGGQSTGAGTGGRILLESGEGNSVHIQTTASRFSDSGDVAIRTGSSAGGNGGDISLATGPSAEGTPGAIRLASGGTSGAADAAGGAVAIAAGDASDDGGTGGSLSLSAGAGD